MALGDNEFFRDGRSLARNLSKIIFVLPAVTLVSLIVVLLGFVRDPAIPVSIAIFSVMLSTVLGLLLERMSSDELGEKKDIAEQSRRAHQQVEELFAMTDMLQAAEDHEDGRSLCSHRVPGT